MPDVLITVLITYLTLTVGGVGALSTALMTGPARLVVFALTLAMAAAPYSQEGPRF